MRNRKMKEHDLYDYLQSLMPSLQFVNPYIDDKPLPEVETDFATFNVLNISDIGWSQPRHEEYDKEAGMITVAYDVQRVYQIQLDFYGPEAFNNASLFKQTLQVNLTKNSNIADLKKISDIRNLTFLQENKKYMKRYNFNVEVFIVDTIKNTSTAIEKAQINIYGFGK